MVIVGIRYIDNDRNGPPSQICRFLQSIIEHSRPMRVGKILMQTKNNLELFYPIGYSTFGISSKCIFEKSSKSAHPRDHATSKSIFFVYFSKLIKFTWKIRNRLNRKKNHISDFSDFYFSSYGHFLNIFVTSSLNLNELFTVTRKIYIGDFFSLFYSFYWAYCASFMKVGSKLRRGCLLVVPWNRAFKFERFRKNNYSFKNIRLFLKKKIRKKRNQVWNFFCDWMTLIGTG